jgi:putative membrane protein
MHRSIARYFRHMDGAQSSAGRRGGRLSCAGAVAAAFTASRARHADFSPLSSTEPTAPPPGILTSRIVRGLLPPLVCVLLSSYLVCCYEELWQEGTLDELVPLIPWPDLAVSPEGPFSISTFALSLLLVFRTNSSYERWWEACTAWNSIVSSVCHLARQTCQWLPSSAPEDERIRAALLRWLTAFPLSLMCYVREEDDKLPALLNGVLLPEEQGLMNRSPVSPQTALTMIGSLISSSRMLIDSKTHMDESVRRMQDAFENCEKIVRTPLPLSYSRHTSRFLVAWLTFLPFCAWKELGWGTVPVDVILGFFLLVSGRQGAGTVGLSRGGGGRDPRRLIFAAIAGCA